MSEFRSDHEVYLDYVAERDAGFERFRRLKAIMAKCEHWGHEEGDWKYSCCACSGIPNGCANCSGIDEEE